LTHPGEKGCYRSDCPTREQPQYELTKVPGWVVLALACYLAFALGLAVGAVLSLVLLG
jgi:hypothetical protein